MGALLMLQASPLSIAERVQAAHDAFNRHPDPQSWLSAAIVVLAFVTVGALCRFVGRRSRSR